MSLHSFTNVVSGTLCQDQRESTELSGDFYMHQLIASEDHDHSDYVYKLQRSFYGLKRAPRIWFFHFGDRLHCIGFNKNDHAESA